MWRTYLPLANFFRDSLQYQIGICQLHFLFCDVNPYCTHKFISSCLDKFKHTNAGRRIKNGNQVQKTLGIIYSMHNALDGGLHKGWVNTPIVHELCIGAFNRKRGRSGRQIFLALYSTEGFFLHSARHAFRPCIKFAFLFYADAAAKAGCSTSCSTHAAAASLPPASSTTTSSTRSPTPPAGTTPISSTRRWPTEIRSA